MGRNYSFDMWVPRDRLFEALSAINRHADNYELALLIWPDGRRLPLGAKRHENESRDLIPFDGSLDRDSGFCLSLPFEADEALREYDEVYQERQRRQQMEVHAVPQQDGKYSIGCIYLYIDQRAEWLEGEAEFVRIDFGAATSSMSDLFAESPSVQSWFVALARDIGAFSCSLNYENFLQPLFVDGENIRSDDESYISLESFDIDAGNAELSLWAIYLKRYPDRKVPRRALLCEGYNSRSSTHERLEVHFCLRDENSGVRAKALKAVAEVEQEAARQTIVDATHDHDWRVRAVAAHLLGHYKIQSDSPTLEQMLADVHPEVRIAAALALGEFSSSYEVLLANLLSNPAAPENLGLIKAALTSVARTNFGPRAIEALELCRTLPDFPFKQTAQEKLNRFPR